MFTIRFYGAGSGTQRNKLRQLTETRHDKRDDAAAVLATVAAILAKLSDHGAAVVRVKVDRVA
jgi:hypothetical protein